MLCKSWRRKWIRGVNETYPVEIRPLACYQQAWKVVTTTFPITLFVLPYAAIRAAIVGIAAAAEEEARSWSRRVVPSRGRNSWTKPRFSARLAAPGNNRSIIINHRFETRLYIYTSPRTEYHNRKQEKSQRRSNFVFRIFQSNFYFFLFFFLF